jgi:hypothetical protein
MKSSTFRIETNPYLAKLQARAAELGWRCFSKEWASTQAKYDFVCANGHHFQRAAKHVLYIDAPHCNACESEATRASSDAFTACKRASSAVATGIGAGTGAGAGSGRTGGFGAV